GVALSRGRQGRRLRGRHRQSFLHHGHGRCAARCRDRRRNRPQGHQGRWHLQCGSQHRSERDALVEHQSRRSDRAPPGSHGRHGVRAVPRPEAADQGLFDQQTGSPPARHLRRGRGHPGSGIGILMSLSDIRRSADERMGKSIESLKASLAKIRTGRAHAGILDHVQVEYYGSPVPVGQVANVTVIDARTLSVQVWEKSMAGPVEKAIRESDLGLNPIAMGDNIRVPMPALTEERRRDLTKVVRSEGEDAKVAVRNLRREANEALKKLLKDKEISEDEDRRGQDEVQKLTDRYVAEIDKLVAQKEAEIMTV